MFLGTTTIILLWSALFSVIWAALCYLMADKMSSLMRIGLSGILPALVVSPIIILFAFSALGINAIFPPQSTTSEAELVVRCAIPALVLCLASGLAWQIAQTVSSEYRTFRLQPFCKFATAMGLKVEHVLFRLVLVKSLAAAWSRCLPWFFGELIVVEAMFNAPGVGYQSWLFARTRDLTGLAQTAGGIVGLYVMVVVLSGMVNQWMGRKLEGYS